VLPPKTAAEILSSLESDFPKYRRPAEAKPIKAGTVKALIDNEGVAETEHLLKSRQNARRLKSAREHLFNETEMIDGIKQAASHAQGKLKLKTTHALADWAEGKLRSASRAAAKVKNLPKFLSEAGNVEDARFATLVTDIAAILSRVNTPEGKARAMAEIRKHNTPVYGTDPKEPGVIIETQPDGTRRRGKFVNRHFMPFTVARQKVASQKQAKPFRKHQPQAKLLSEMSETERLACLAGTDERCDLVGVPGVTSAVTRSLVAKKHGPKKKKK
jgi:hypothetical protein